tara:strand:+ start:94 stop:537 length:444 start_codon:yes stop_codon:yes gene_type:complete
MDTQFCILKLLNNSKDNIPNTTFQTVFDLVSKLQWNKTPIATKREILQKSIKLKKRKIVQLNNEKNARISNKNRQEYYKDVFEYQGPSKNKELKIFEQTNPVLKTKRAHVRRKDIKVHKLSVLDNGIRKKKLALKKLRKSFDRCPLH